MAGGSARVLPFIGLTGGLGAGKSTALELLDELGVATISADEIVHELYTTAEVRELLVGRWGPVVAPDGEVDRAAVAEKVFGDAEELGWLERLLWPRVWTEVGRVRERAIASDPAPRAVVVEIPLLFEAGLQDRFDATVAIVASELERELRTRARGQAAIAEREARQLSQAEKAARADHAIGNDGSIDDLKASLSRVLDEIEAGR